MTRPGGPVEFFVDVDELGRLRGELQTLEAELGDLPVQGMNADATAGDLAARERRFFSQGRVRTARLASLTGVSRISWINRPLAPAPATSFLRRRGTPDRAGR